MKFVHKQRQTRRSTEPAEVEQSEVDYSRWTEVSKDAQDSADHIQAELDAYAASKYRR